MLYLAELPDDERTYYAGSQRPHLDGRVAEFTGVQAERRAEGTAMVEPAQQSRALTDLRFPFKLTDRQAALLLCAPLAQAHYEDEPGLTRAQLLRETRALVERYGSHWGRSPDSAEVELLLDNALRVLVALKLVGVDGELVRPLPALARFQSAAVRAPHRPEEPPHDRPRAAARALHARPRRPAEPVRVRRAGGLVRRRPDSGPRRQSASFDTEHGS